MATWGATEISADLDDGHEEVGAGGPSAGGLDSDGLVIGVRGTNEFAILLRFPNVTVPQGATIDSCTLEVYIAYETGSAFDVEIYGEDVDDAAQLDTGDNDNISSRTKTTNYVTWAWPYTGDGSYETTDPTDAIQEVINRGSWSSGNALALILVPASGTSDGNWGQVEDSSTITGAEHAAKLTINYTEGGSVSVVPILATQSARRRRIISVLLATLLFLPGVYLTFGGKE